MPVISRCAKCGDWPVLITEQHLEGQRVFYACINTKCGTSVIEQAAASWNSRQELISGKQKEGE